MSAPTDRPQDPKSVAFYAPAGQRAARLGQVSEAAAALVPDQPHDVARAHTGELFEGDVGMRRLRARSALDPDFVPGPPPPAMRTRSWFGAAARLTLLLATAAVVALVVIGQVPLPSLWQQPSSDRKAAELSSASSRSVAAVTPAKRPDPVIPRLIVQDARGNRGEPAPLGVTLEGRADGALVLISGLVPGMTVSTGGAVGADAWQVPVTELAGAWILPAKDFVGVVDLTAELRFADNTVVQRRPIHLEWVAPATAVTASAAAASAAPAAAAASAPASAAPSVAAPAAPSAPAPNVVVAAAAPVATAPSVAAPPAAAPAATAPSVAAPPVAAPAAAVPAVAAPTAAASPPIVAAAGPSAGADAARQIDADEIAILLKRGKDFIVNGDIAGARLILRRAAEANNADAALVLAATYDPLVLRELKVFGVAGDAATARTWYEKAKELGSPDARRRLEILASAPR